LYTIDLFFANFLAFESNFPTKCREVGIEKGDCRKTVSNGMRLSVLLIDNVWLNYSHFIATTSPFSSPLALKSYISQNRKLQCNAYHAASGQNVRKYA